MHKMDCKYFVTFLTFFDRKFLYILHLLCYHIHEVYTLPACLIRKEADYRPRIACNRALTVSGRRKQNDKNAMQRVELCKCEKFLQMHREEAAGTSKSIKKYLKRANCPKGQDAKLRGLKRKQWQPGRQCFEILYNKF